MSHSHSSEVPASSGRRVRELLLAYGADPARWPAAERTAAQLTLAQWPELLALAKSEAALDAMLELGELPASMKMDEAALVRCLPPSGVSMLPVMTRHADSSMQVRSDSGWRWAAPALAAAISLGIGMGWWLPQVDPSTGVTTVADVEDVIEYAQIDAEYEEFLP
jgi:hypothetical protein